MNPLNRPTRVKVRFRGGGEKINFMGGVKLFLE